MTDPRCDERFLRRYHRDAAGITEDLLDTARNASGRNPYQWLVEAVPARGLVLDLACGSAPVAGLVGHDRYLGVDTSPDELAVAARRRPSARTRLGDAGEVTGPAAAVTVSMALMLLDLDAVLAAAARALVPGGVFAAIVPTRDVSPRTRYGQLLALLGLAGRPFPEPLPAASLPAAFARRGLALRSDELAWFDRPLRTADDVELVLRSFYREPGDENPARELLTAGPDMLRYPVRRIIAVRAQPSGRSSRASHSRTARPTPAVSDFSE